MHKHLLSALCILTLLVGDALAEDIRIATYNVERFQENFSAHMIRQTRKDFAKDPENKPILEQLKKSNDENNWEVAQVILNEKMNPDIIGFEECCDEENLKYFNDRWLRKAYGTVIVFPTNTTRDQHLGMLLKPGFKVIERKDQYYQEKDPVENPRGEKLFARGPAFVLVEAPSGYRFWVGVTHQKSKSGAKETGGPDTAWRNREAKRTHEIMKDLAAQGPDDVILVGDLNDELGLDKEYEKDNGGDTIANLVGPETDGFVLATKPLIDAGKISYGNYWQNFHRTFIDGMVISPGVKDQVKEVTVYTEGLAPVASDHYPVILTIKADPVSATQPTK